MPRRLFAFAVIVLTLALVGSVQAGHSTTSVRVVECRSSDAGETRSATFLGRMRAVAGTHRMAMRFTLLERFGDEKLHEVDFPDLRAWRHSNARVRDFRFRQTVTALQGGGDYRMKIEYRWFDSAGKLQRKVKRRSRPCRQPGELPNLRAGEPAGSPGEEGTAVYVVPVRNDGRATAREVGVALYVDGAATNVTHIESIAAGETREVRFSGPVCQRGLRVVVDPADSVKERRESDNVTRSTCPTSAR